MCSYCSEVNQEKDLEGTDGICFDEKTCTYYLYIEHFRYEKNRVTNIKYCPYCGRKLEHSI